jgi:hypothetical protein
MENEKFYEIKNLTPNLVFDSLSMLDYNFQGEEYINFLKVVPNNEEFLIITNQHYLLNYKIKYSNYEETNIPTPNLNFIFRETNYIYDCDMYVF